MLARRGPGGGRFNLQRETGLVLEDNYKYEDLFGKKATKVLKVAKFLEMSLQKRIHTTRSRSMSFA